MHLLNFDIQFYPDIYIKHLYLCLNLDRIVCLIVALVGEMIKSYSASTLKEMEYFFYYEIPFNFIITGLIVQFHQWFSFAIFIKHAFNPDKLTDLKLKIKLSLLISIIISLSCLILQFTAVVLENTIENAYDSPFKQQQSSQINDFNHYRIMDWVMIVLYTVVTFSFVPMLLGLICKIKRNFNQVYKKIKWKYLLLLGLFMVFLFFRIYLYLDLKELNGSLMITTMYTPIPFYISEILMSMFLSYILFNVNENESGTENRNSDSQNISNIILYSENGNNQPFQQNGQFLFKAADQANGNKIHLQYDELSTGLPEDKSKRGNSVESYIQERNATQNYLRNTVKSTIAQQHKYSGTTTLRALKDSELSMGSFDQPQTIEEDDDEALSEQRLSQDMYPTQSIGSLEDRNLRYTMTNFMNPNHTEASNAYRGESAGNNPFKTPIYSPKSMHKQYQEEDISMKHNRSILSKLGSVFRKKTKAQTLSNGGDNCSLNADIQPMLSTNHNLQTQSK
ncbi:UNKNOWN [Stylonychia lemnae]|uniref:Transmembrane protein n=1 Tax=Stylonychia lemnae TaxID=5949 RepID=A0A078AIS3_STYLE|nr:UNKNOWN [Stylonychia lemnae]|eukprot:CDW81831.1 UNKNOWN [Stylonychia lemnae]